MSIWFFLAAFLGGMAPVAVVGLWYRANRDVSYECGNKDCRRSELARAGRTMFCTQCGTKMRQAEYWLRCSQCGRRGTTAFCQRCGTKLR